MGGQLLARLQMHPITNFAADRIHTIMNLKVKAYYRELFAADPNILTAPLAQGGLDFPNIQKWNKTWAVTNLHRALNSNNPTIKLATEIMHATLQCGGEKAYHCFLPFATPREKGHKGRQNNFVAWEIPRRHIAQSGMMILPTESLSRGRNKAHNRATPYDEIWKKSNDHQSNIVSQIESRVRTSGPVMTRDSIKWATDGSADPPKLWEATQVAMAVVGPVHFSARLADGYATIQDAEVTAIAVAIILDLRYRELHSIQDSVPTTIYTDHLNTIRRINNGRARDPIAPGTASRHVLRWLVNMVQTHPNLSLIHQKAHTDEKTMEALMNDEADKAAKAARTGSVVIKTPIEYVDSFMISFKYIGVSHRDVKEMLDQAWDRQTENKISRTGNVFRYQDKRLFLTARSAFSAQVQLQARSGQLQTQKTKRERYVYTPHDHCLLCPNPVLQTDEDHVFLRCPAVQDILLEGNAEATRILETFCAEKKAIEEQQLRAHRHLITILLRDDDRWVGGKSLYWRGELPGNFEYNARFEKLYEQLSGLCVRTAARAWSLHKKAASERANQIAPNHTPPRPENADDSDDDEEDNEVEA